MKGIQEMMIRLMIMTVYPMFKFIFFLDRVVTSLNLITHELQQMCHLFGYDILLFFIATKINNLSSNSLLIRGQINTKMIPSAILANWQPSFMNVLLLNPA
ncbi:hypothetical protein D3C73_1238370 [compost metagenome]